MLEGKAILVSDDDLTLAEMYELRLKAEGALVAVAHNGREAIEMMEANQPDIILLDIMMPEMSGFDVLKYMQDNPNLAKIPVIVLTALIENDKYQHARELGAKGYIVKSQSTPADVVAKIKEILTGSQQPAS